MPELASPILIASYSDKKYQWECLDLERKSLREVIVSFRDQVNLADLPELSARCLPQGNSLELEKEFSEVLERLRNGGQLEVSDSNGLVLHHFVLDETGLLEKETDRSEVTSKYRPPIQRSNKTLKLVKVGSLITHGQVSYEAQITTIKNDMVQIPRNMLPLLRDNLDNDPTLKWINRFLGLFLGALLSALVSLQDSNLKSEFRSALWVVLIMCLLTSVIFVGLEVIVERRRAELLKPLMDDLSAEVESDGATRKSI